jgi:hypothetical protein
MMKPAAVTLLFAVPLLATSASADTVTTEADTLVVVTPNAPIIVQQGGGPASVASMAPGAAEMPPAPPPAPAASNGAPQNEDWNNVSHINGTPVKVGERGDYLIKGKKNNISGNPFGLFFGYYDVAFSHSLSQNLAASVAITGWSMSEGYTQGYQVAATLPLYFRRTFSGPYLEGGLMLRTDTSDDSYYAYSDCYDCMSYSSSNAWIGPELLFGWQWTFDSGLNVAMAFGVAKNMTSESNEPDANGYFRVGYAF